MIEFFRRLALVAIFIAVSGAFAVTAYVIYKTQDPIVRIESLLLDENSKDNKIEKALFSPDDEIKEVLLALIHNEKKHIRVATYTFTEKDLAHALMDAHARGVVIEIVADKGYAGDRFTKIEQFARKQMPVWVFQAAADDRSAGLMHNKFMIFSDTLFNRAILVTGSYNFTKRAGLANQENVIITDSHSLIESFAKQFEVLKSRSLAISGNIEYQLPEIPQKKSSLIDWIENLIIAR